MNDERRDGGSDGWRALLADLDRLTAAAPAITPLGWEVSFERGKLSIEPVRDEETRARRPTPPEREALRGRPWGLSTVDAEVAALAVSAPTLALVRLVGHPRVWRQGRRIPVLRSELRIALRARDDGGATAEVQVDGVARARLDAVAAGGWLVLLDEDALRVVPADARTLDLIRLLRWRGGELPPEAVDPLRRRLGSLSALGVVADAELGGRTRPAWTTWTLRAEADASALRLSAMVHPFGDERAWPLGEGPREEHGTEGSTRVRWVRDDAAELAALDALATSAGLTGRGPWAVSGEDAGLELLARLEATAAPVTWRSPPRRPIGVIDTLQVTATEADGRTTLRGEVSGAGHRWTIDAALAALRAGRRWLPAGEAAWAELSAPLRARLTALDEAADAGPLGLPALLDAGAELSGWAERLAALRADDAPVPAGLRATLRDYQLAGFRFLARLAGWAPGAILADDMGLGKTVQAIALLLHRADRPALVIAPTSLVAPWRDALTRFAPSLTVPVVSWGEALARADELAATRFGTVILDEAQALKNPATRRAAMVARLDADFRVALTGTPVENRASDLWSIARVTLPGLLGEREAFRERWGAAAERGDPEARAALARRIGPFVLRRRKEDVAPELPPRIELIEPVLLSPAERALYDGVREAARAVVALAGPDARRPLLLTAIGRLRQLACHPRLVEPASAVPSSKLTRARRLLGDLLDAGSHVLVFSSSTRHLALLAEALERDGRRFRRLDGGMSPGRRASEIASFEAGDAPLFLISLKAGGTGLTLTSADAVVLLDPWWNPAVEDQAADRAHRIGQTRPVTVLRLVTTDTVEERILSMHADKRKLAADLLDGAGASLGPDELLALLD